MAPRTSNHPSALWVILGGIASLAIAIGVGRFAFTPILPIMQQATGFGTDFAGLLASANYAGYLIGAIAFGYVPPARRLVSFRISLLLCVLLTGWMGLSDSQATWFVLRGLTGIASAGVFVLGSVLVLDRLNTMGYTNAGGQIFGGVGVGIVLTGIAVPGLDMFFGWQGTWIGTAFLSLFLLLLAWLYVQAQPVTAYASDSKAASATTKPTAGGAPMMRLWAAYFCVGFGYIISATFLVAILQQKTGSAFVSQSAWVLVGGAVAVSTLFWPRFSSRFGLVKSLIVAHSIQAVGIILPVFFDYSWAAYMGAICFGGTFMGIVGMSLIYGRTLAQGGQVVGWLTGLFSLGQIIAPVIAGFMAVSRESFDAPLVMAALVVAAGAVLLWPDRHRS
ncbi:YbfB/YjiJ family MFS transporter [Desulfurispira natronophila]|uniref:Putative MFS family arabinose efflux permease n=1 Tax=Desulfurispira natronophila TaxID=682562 RepID=A0A7W8DHM7_9BACT|nr:YbfB/YjiJ family MFS transporter [Desulfurispira natronophila]MBB5022532.1 putative MFS family arabinose efflux permease [Desulfurispira natronophila]